MPLIRRWMAKGTVFLSNVRLVFVAQEADPSGASYMLYVAMCVI